MQPKEFWMHVILRAQAEAAGECLRGEDVARVSARARRWLTVKNPGFDMICELAGFTDRMTNKLREQEREKWKKRTQES